MLSPQKHWPRTVTRPARARAQATQNATHSPVASNLGTSETADDFLYPRDPAVTPARPTVWHLFFAARPSLPAELRPRTKSGKLKKLPPRLPPNINERRAMHPMVERRLIDYWRSLVPIEVRRQHAMRRLDRARISAVIYRRNLGVADGSGDFERVKPLVDGLVDANVIPNDRRREVEYGEVSEQHIGYRGEGVLLIVEELPPAGADRAGGASE